MRSTFPQDISSFLLRVGFGMLLLLGHGIPKWERLLAGFNGAEIKFYSFLGLSPTISLSLAVFAEVLCAILVIIGFKVRYTVIPLVITMAVAIFMKNAESPWLLKDADGSGAKELGLLFLIPFVALIFMGSGKFSVDQLISKS